jgi:spore germination protein KB
MTQISRLQFRYLLLWMILGTGILALPFSIAQFTVRDGWIVPLFFFVGTALVTAVGVLFIRTFPNQSLMNGLETAFGPWIGRAAGIWMLILFLIFAGTLLRELSVFVETTSLPKTPLYLISAVITVPIAFAVFQGLEVVGRLAEFLTPVAFIIAVVITALSFQNVDLSQLRPILANGWTPVLRASLMPATTFPFEFIVALQFVKSLSDVPSFGKDMLLVGAFLSIIGIGIEIIVICTLGSSVAYLSLPVVEVIRGIGIGHFVERLDTIYIMGVIATMVIKICTILYVTASGLQDVFRLPSTKNIAWTVGTAVWTANVVLFPNSPALQEFIIFMSPAYYTFSLVMLPLLAVLIYRMRNLKKSH